MHTNSNYKYLFILFVYTDITCTSLSAPMNGFITYATDNSEPYEFRTIATYGCNNGYGLSNGDTVRTCVAASQGGASQGGGQWSGLAPICLRKLFD